MASGIPILDAKIALIDARLDRIEKALSVLLKVKKERDA